MLGSSNGDALVEMDVGEEIKRWYNLEFRYLEKKQVRVMDIRIR